MFSIIVVFLASMAAGVLVGYDIGRFPGFNFCDRATGLFAEVRNDAWTRIKTRIKNGTHW